MNPAIFNLANLNLTVTIDAKARVWAAENYVSLEACAWEFALKHAAGQRPFVPSAGSITVEPLVKPCMTDGDGKRGGGVPVAQAQAPVISTPRINAAPVADSVPASVRWYANGGADAWEYVCFDDDDGIYWFHKDGAHGIGCLYSESDKNFEPRTPQAAANWLRANNHAVEADPLAGARVFIEPGTKVGYETVLLANGDCYYRQRQWWWNVTAKCRVEGEEWSCDNDHKSYLECAGTYTEITNTPAAKEILRGLREHLEAKG